MKVIIFKSKRKPIYCFGIDDNYLWPLLVCLYSAKKNFEKFEGVHIVYDPNYLHERSLNEVKNACELLGINPIFVPLQVPNNVIGQGHITPTSYLRLQVPELFRGKVFWFDTDLLFLNRWQKISKYAMRSKSSKEAIMARLHWGDPKSSSNQAIIKSDGKYFNSGLLLINSEIWKSRNISKELSHIIPNYIQLGFEWADQCLLNYYFKGNYGKIHPKFNAIPAEYVRNRTRIIHFAGSHKPWTLRTNSDCEIVNRDGILQISDLQPEDKNAWELYRRIESELFKILYERKRPK
jgi:lipopolysaccharide biosynthesis glycosyltransferase